MNFKEYQNKAARTDLNISLQLDIIKSGLLNAAIGLSGEAGEVLDTIKK